MTVLRHLSRHKVKYLTGWLALELLSLPFALSASAGMVERVSFSPAPQVIVADTHDSAPGRQSFLVASNAPFVVEVTGVIGRVDVDVQTRGQLGSLAYGTNAQSPGETTRCSFARLGITQVYRAERKTAANPGEVQTQAVRVNVRYDEKAEPDIRIVPLADAYALPGDTCAENVS